MFADDLDLPRTGTTMNPRESALPRPLALRLAATEYDLCTAVFFLSLEPGHWTAPTDCPAWDVRQMAAHMLGMAEMAASMRENLRQQRLARPRPGHAGGLYIDALTQLQVHKRPGWAPDRITGRYQARAPKAVTGRRRAHVIHPPPRHVPAQRHQRRPGAVDLRLPHRHHPDPRPVDAPPRHHPGHRDPAASDRRS